MKNLQKIEQHVLASFFKDTVTEDLYEDNKKILLQLKEEYFYLPAHQKIFKLMKTTVEDGKDLDTSFLALKIIKELESPFLGIISTTAISNIHQYIQELKLNYENLQIEKLEIEAKKKRLENKDVDYSEIASQYQKMHQLKNDTGVLKPLDLSVFDDIDLSSEEIENEKFDYIIDNFIVKAEITLTAAAPGSGKSLTTIAIANMALEQNKVSHVFYFDLDNAKTTLKQRKLDVLKNKWKDKLKYAHGSKLDKREAMIRIKKLQTMDLTDTLIIFDSAKNFLLGDRDKNKDVSELMNEFKKLRDNGATVILLHHTNKPSQDLERLVFAGSAAWEEDTTNAYYLTKNDNKNTFVYQWFKPRVGILENFAFTYDEDSFRLNQVDLKIGSLTDLDEEIIEEIKIYIDDNKQEPENRTQHKIVTHVNKLGYGRDKVARLLKELTELYWNAISQPALKNRKVYSLLNSNEPEITNYIANNDISLDSSRKLENLGNSMFKANTEQETKKKNLGNSETKTNFMYIQESSNIEIPFIE